MNVYYPSLLARISFMQFICASWILIVLMLIWFLVVQFSWVLAGMQAVRTVKQFIEVMDPRDKPRRLLSLLDMFSNLPKSKVWSTSLVLSPRCYQRIHPLLDQKYPFHPWFIFRWIAWVADLGLFSNQVWLWWDCFTIRKVQDQCPITSWRKRAGNPMKSWETESAECLILVM